MHNKKKNKTGRKREREIKMEKPTNMKTLAHNKYNHSYSISLHRKQRSFCQIEQKFFFSLIASEINE